VKPFTFSNGMTFPVGTDLGVATWPMIMPKNSMVSGFTNSGSNMMDPRQGYTQRTRVSTTFNLVMVYMHGTPFQSAWVDNSPGRFFAISEVKLLLAIMLLKYDLQTRDRKRPASTYLQQVCIPNRTAEVLLKRRGKGYEAYDGSNADVS